MTIPLAVTVEVVVPADLPTVACEGLKDIEPATPFLCNNTNAVSEVLPLVKETANTAFCILEVVLLAV